jgi:membrane-bound ClpP family serine protease
MDNVHLGFILIGVALLLLLAELFLSTGGILLAVAGLVDLIGLVVVFVYGEPYVGLVTLAAEAIILPLAASLMFYVWPHTPMGRRLIMRRTESASATLAETAVYQQLEQLRGHIGKATSVMRPAGVVEFDGHRVDCLSEGILIEPDTWVRCIDVKAGRVIVRPIDAPDIGLDPTDLT